jgi:hypothetical protein
MPWRNWSPVIYGGVFGTLAGGVGIIQIIVVVRDFAAQNAAFDKRYPPGYTGFRDATNHVRGGEWNFVGTALEALGVIAILLTIAATLAVVATRKSHTGVVTTLIAGAVSTIFYVVASVIALSTGFHPMAPFQDSWQNSIPGCVAVCAITAFVLAWISGLIGAGLGALIGRRFPR